MTYAEWKKLKHESGENVKKMVRDFERNNPYTVQQYEQQEKQENEQLRNAMKIEDRHERWKKIAKLTHDPLEEQRRKRADSEY